MPFTPMSNERCDDCGIHPMSLTRQECGGATCGDCDATHASKCLDCDCDHPDMQPVGDGSHRCPGCDLLYEPEAIS